VDATMPSEAGLMRSRSVFLEDGRRLFNIGTMAPDAVWPAVEATQADEASAQNDRPTQAADVALADDAASLDPEHPLNQRLRDAGAGLVPNVVMVATRERFASVAAGAIEQVFRVPLGWHVIDDGKRTLVFDAGGRVQVNLDLRRARHDALTDVLEAIGDALAQESPTAQFLRLEIIGMPCLGVRDLPVNGELLDQAYFVRPSHREGLALVCRVTADRENITRAMNLAEVILTSAHGPLPPDPEFAGQPDWWRTAVLLERADRLDEAEREILQALDHIGVYSSLARLYEERVARLVHAGREEEASAARERAIHWLTVYASSATSGGEGAALSRERDLRIAALGGRPPRP
jgi:hypothetical protein